MLRRIITALAMVPLLVVAILYGGPWLFQGLTLLCIAVALSEYFRIVWPESARVDQVFATVLGVICAAWWIWGGGSLPVLLVPSALVIVAFIYFAVQPSPAEAHHRVGHLVFGIIYVAGLGSQIALLRALPDAIFWVFVVLAATWFNDTMAYFTGHAWGRHRMAPHLSPGKTWEGWAGGVLGSALGVYLFWWWLPNPLTAMQALGLVGLAAVFGPIGDLA